MRLFNCITILAIAFLIGCSTTQNELQNASKDTQAIKTLIDDYTTAVNNHDTTAYVKLFSDDVVWAPPNAPVAKSKSEIKENVQSRFDKFNFNLSIVPFEIKIMGNYAYALADADLVLTPKNGDAEINTQITAIWIFKKQGEKWKIYRQLYNNKAN